MEGWLSNAHGVASTLRVAGAIHPLRRFVVGNDKTGFVLSHPRFADFIREDYLDEATLESTREAFSNWGHTELAELESGTRTSEKASRYLLQFALQHFRDTATHSKDMDALTKNLWAKAWFSFEGNYRGFANDVSGVAAIISSDSSESTSSNSNFGYRFRCELILSSIRSIGQNVPSDLMIACYKLGIVSIRQAISWLEYCNIVDRADVVGQLHESFPKNELDHILERLVSQIGRIDYAPNRCRAWAAIAPALSGQQLVWAMDEALASVMALEDLSSRAEALNTLVEFVPSERMLAIRRTMLGECPQMTEYVSYRVSAITFLAMHLPSPEKESTAREALILSDSIGHGSWRLSALQKLVPELPDELIEEAFAKIRPDDELQYRLSAQMAFLPRLSAEKREALVSELLHSISRIDDVQKRGRLLAQIAVHAPIDERERVQEEALAAAESGDDMECSIILGILGPNLPSNLLSLAANISFNIGDRFSGQRSLGKLSAYFDEATARECLSRAQEIGDGDLTALVLEAIGSTGLPSQAERLSRTALEFAQRARDPSARVGTLLSLANASPAGRKSILALALAHARASKGSERRSRLLWQVARECKGAERRTIWGEAFDAALAMGGDLHFSWALQRLIPELLDDQLALALAATRRLSGTLAGTTSLYAELALRASGKAKAALVDEAIADLATITDDQTKIWAVATILKVCDGELHGKLTEELMSVINNLDLINRIEMAGSVRESLPGDVFESIMQFEITEVIDVTEEREHVLCDILRGVGAYLNEKQVFDALSLISKLKSGMYAAWSLGSLLPALKNCHIDKALEVAFSFEYTGYQYNPVVHLMPHCNPIQIAKILEYVDSLWDDLYAANIIVGLLEHEVAGDRADLLIRFLDRARYVRRDQLLRNVCVIAKFAPTCSDSMDGHPLHESVVDVCGMFP